MLSRYRSDQSLPRATRVRMASVSPSESRWTSSSVLCRCGEILSDAPRTAAKQLTLASRQRVTPARLRLGSPGSPALSVLRSELDDSKPANRGSRNSVGPQRRPDSEHRLKC
jgi:hypothetical protein